ncbi:MAG: hypothetical protein ACXQTR_06560 [Candidatus Methanospirareceae archaeon]
MADQEKNAPDDPPLIIEISALKERVARLEERTSAIEKFMSSLEERLGKLEKHLEKIDGRVWAILSGVILSILIQILAGVL